MSYDDKKDRKGIGFSLGLDKVSCIMGNLEVDLLSLKDL
jgi:hypothetical protein